MQLRADPASIYMAPEMFERDGSPGPASDQFAFCVALFEAMHGLQPFPTRELAERLRAIRGRALSPVPEDSDVPMWLRAVVARGLDPEPALRHPDMPALLRALDPVATPRGVGDMATIRARIHPLGPGVIRYHEVTLPSAFSVEVMRGDLTRLTADGAPYTLVVELDEASMPGPEVRKHIGPHMHWHIDIAIVDREGMDSTAHQRTKAGAGRGRSSCAAMGYWTHGRKSAKVGW